MKKYEGIIWLMFFVALFTIGVVLGKDRADKIDNGEITQVSEQYMK